MIDLIRRVAAGLQDLACVAADILGPVDSGAEFDCPDDQYAAPLGGRLNYRTGAVDSGLDPYGLYDDD